MSKMSVEYWAVFVCIVTISGFRSVFPSNITTSKPIVINITDNFNTTTESNVSDNTIFMMYPENQRFNEILKFLITSKENTTVQVFADTPSYQQNFTIKSGSGIGGNVLAVSQLDRGIVETKGISMISDKNVSVYGISHYDCCNTDGFYALPYKGLGTSYKTISYHGPQNSFVGVLGTHGNTDVNITLNFTGVIDWKDDKIRAGYTVQINLDRLSTFQFLTDRDLTGTTITSNKPVAVMSGNTCSYVLGATCNHLVEFLPPISNWGRTFVIPTIKTASRMIIRVVPSTLDSIVTFYDFRGPHEIKINGTYEITLLAATLYLLKCDTPCLVAQYAVYTQRHPAPFMTLVPAVEHYENQYTFITPDVADFNNYFTIVTLQKHVDDIRFDDIQITRIRYIEQHLLNADGEYWVSLSIMIPSGVHTLKHAHSDVGFGAIGYGFKPYDAYGFPLGMKMPVE